MSTAENSSYSEYRKHMPEFLLIHSKNILKDAQKREEPSLINKEDSSWVMFSSTELFSVALRGRLQVIRK